MSVFEIILISIGLAMDAFGVSIGKGLSMPVGENGRKVTLAFLFGLFQFLMPVMGWLIGRQFIDVISEWDHWIIFGLLGYLGIAMIREGLSDETDEDDDKRFLGAWEMIVLSVATSLDAMAVGLTFAFLPINVWEASTMIGGNYLWYFSYWCVPRQIYGPVRGKICRHTRWRCIDSHRYKNTFTTPRYYWRILKVCIYMKVS